MADITPEDIRFVRSGCAKNLATLLRRAVLKLKAASMTGLANAQSKTQTTNTVRVLLRIVPYVVVICPPVLPFPPTFVCPRPGCGGLVGRGGHC